MKEYSQNLISIDQVEEFFSVDKIGILKDAKKEKLSLYRLSSGGNWEKIPPLTLECFIKNRFKPRTIEGPASMLLNAYMDLSFDQIRVDPKELKKLYPSNIKSTDNHQTLDELLNLVSEREFPDDIDPFDERGMRKSIKTLKDKYPNTVFLSNRIMLESAYIESNQIKWKKYSRKEIEEMAKNDGLSKVIGRTIHKNLPAIMKKSN